MGSKRVPADDGSRCGPGINIPANPTHPETGQSPWLVLFRKITHRDQGSAKVY